MVSLPVLLAVAILLTGCSAMLIVRGYVNELEDAINSDFEWLYSRPVSQHTLAYMNRWWL